MKAKKFNLLLNDLSACEDAKLFAADKSLKEVWDTCPRGDWMLWLAKKADVDIRTLTKAKALCANTVRHLMKDKRSTNAIDVAIKFGDGIVELPELNAATAYAAAAYAATAYAAAAYAAYAAAYAAADADDAADDAAYAAADDAARAATAYAAADAAAYARKENQLATANICREQIPYKLIKSQLEKLKP